MISSLPNETLVQGVDLQGEIQDAQVDMGGNLHVFLNNLVEEQRRTNALLERILLLMNAETGDNL